MSRAVGVWGVSRRCEARWTSDAKPELPQGCAGIAGWKHRCRIGRGATAVGSGTTRGRGHRSSGSACGSTSRVPRPCATSERSHRSFSLRKARRNGAVIAASVAGSPPRGGQRESDAGGLSGSRLLRDLRVWVVQLAAGCETGRRRVRSLRRLGGGATGLRAVLRAPTPRRGGHGTAVVECGVCGRPQHDPAQLISS